MPLDRHLKDPQRESQLYFGRVIVAAVVVLLIAGGLVSRYHHLQVDRHRDFVARSDSNRIHVRPVPPIRGLIRDRNGVLLADNRPSFTLRIVKEHVADFELLLAELRKLLPVSDSDVKKFTKQVRRRDRRPYEASTLRYNLTENEQSVLAVNAYRLPGVEVAAQLVRHYPQGPAMAHVTGYVRSMDEGDLRNFTEDDERAYRGTHLIGKRGLEFSYERQLLGQVGSENVETNSRGRVMRVLERTDPVPGSDLTLFLDARLQQLGAEALVGERGSVVALDVRTGGVLAMVSAPSYDANIYVTGMTQKDVEWLNSIERPLVNRSVRGVYPPASTVKPAYGLAALESGVVTPDTIIYDPGFFQLPGEERKFRDWKREGHGRVNLKAAIAQSCDTYYYKVSYEMGIDKMAPYGFMFGLGQPTGIDLSGEKIGIMPNRDWTRGVKGRAWYPGDTINTSIGQGFTTATPMQLAVMAMRLANRGASRPPQLVKAINGVDVALEPATKHALASDANWDTVLAAMEEVVHGVRGTAKSISADLTYRIAGKTGTAQVIGIPEDAEYDSEVIAKSHRDHALFIGYAPADDPQIAVAVVIENGEKSSRSAKVARTLMDAWVKGFPAADTEAAAEYNLAAGERSER